MVLVERPADQRVQVSSLNKAEGTDVLLSLILHWRRIVRNSPMSVFSLALTLGKQGLN